MCTLDQDILEMIIETKNNVAHIVKQLDNGIIKYDKMESRIRRLELLFIPCIIVMTYFSNKIIEVI